MSITKKVVFYTRKLLDGKYHIFKRTELSSNIDVEELDILLDDEAMAENYILAKNLESRIEEVDLG